MRGKGAEVAARPEDLGQQLHGCTMLSDDDDEYTYLHMWAFSLLLMKRL